MITIRKFKKSDTAHCASLIAKTYQEFNHDEGSKKAIQSYIDYFNVKKRGLDELEKNFCSSSICFVACDKQQIVGIVRGGKNRTSNLFVAGKYHKMGIGKKLMNKFEATAKKNGSKKIKIRASLYAVPFYTKMGYKKTTGQRTFWGLKNQPMKKII